LGKNDWNGVQVKLQQTYWPYNTPSPIMKQLINGLSTIAWMMSAASGPLGPLISVGVGGTVALTAGVFGGINLSLTESDESLANLAELEANTQVWYQTVFNQLAWTNNNLTQRGWYVVDAAGIDVSAGLPDIIDDGKWVDYTKIAALNDATGPQVGIDVLKQAFYTFVLGNMVNFAWRSQGVFIVKYQMSEDDFNKKGDDWTPGNGDANFRTYDDGHAYFLQRYTPDNDQFLNQPMSAYPPGWDEVATDLNGCDPPCIMRSAARGFKEHGYNYNFTEDAADFTQATALTWLTDVPSVPGFFNIPVADLSGSISNIDDLNDVLVDKDYHYGNIDGKSAWCYARDQKDANGVTFVSTQDPELVKIFDENNCMEQCPAGVENCYG